MPKELELKIDDNGNLASIFSDEMNDLYNVLGVVTITRCSDVEYKKGKGWTVRSHANPRKALRTMGDGCSHKIVVSRDGPIRYFATREKALDQEIKFFWELL